MCNISRPDFFVVGKCPYGSNQEAKCSQVEEEQEKEFQFTHGNCTLNDGSDYTS